MTDAGGRPGWPVTRGRTEASTKPFERPEVVIVDEVEGGRAIRVSVAQGGDARLVVMPESPTSFVVSVREGDEA